MFTLMVMFLIRIYFIMPSREIEEKKIKKPTILCVLGSGGQFEFFLNKIIVQLK
jgi:hypothetical protein